MEIDFCGVIIDIGTRIQEERGDQLQLECQPNFGIKTKATKVPKVSMEKVEDSPPRLQPKSTLNGAVALIIELPCDLVGLITKFIIGFNRTKIMVNNSVKYLRIFVTLFCDSKDVIPFRKEDNVEVRNIFVIKTHYV
jgi:hypothetical protein